MSKIRINKNIDSASSIPTAVRGELAGKVLVLYQPLKVFVVGQPTVGSEEAVERYDKLCSDSYVVTREELWRCAIEHRLPNTVNWIDEMLDCPLFFFGRQYCTFQI